MLLLAPHLGQRWPQLRARHRLEPAHDLVVVELVAGPVARGRAVAALGPADVQIVEAVVRVVERVPLGLLALANAAVLAAGAVLLARVAVRWRASVDLRLRALDGILAQNV